MNIDQIIDICNVNKPTQSLLDELQSFAANMQTTGGQQIQNREIPHNNSDTIKDAKSSLKPCIYIFDTDSRVPCENSTKLLKLGITENLKKRMKPYHQIAPYGSFVFSIELDKEYLRTTEQWIHMLLKRYHVKGELFEMSIKEATLVVKHVVNSIRLSRHPNCSTLLPKLTGVMHETKRSVQTQTTF
jgi:hypothetical protein